MRLMFGIMFFVCGLAMFIVGLDNGDASVILSALIFLIPGILLLRRKKQKVSTDNTVTHSANRTTTQTQEKASGKQAKKNKGAKGAGSSAGVTSGSASGSGEKVCKHCGATMQGSLLYCSHCGYKL
ncbi:MAG: zinc ribbon domain-containing protein [Lachnospiraceae bacterium]|nr:zinc ribbon domain-containing protein [Lachnospiraceae bacterium]